MSVGSRDTSVLRLLPLPHFWLMFWDVQVSTANHSIWKFRLLVNFVINLHQKWIRCQKRFQHKIRIRIVKRKWFKTSFCVLRRFIFHFRIGLFCVRWPLIDFTFDAMFGQTRIHHVEKENKLIQLMILWLEKFISITNNYSSIKETTEEKHLLNKWKSFSSH